MKTTPRAFLKGLFMKGKATLAFAFAAFLIAPALAQTNMPAGPEPGSNEEMAEIAKKLNNPVASLISIPLQNNFDFGGGPNDDGFEYKLNFQPVVPITLNSNWNV